MADMNLALRIRVNADGSVQVLNQVGQSVRGVGNAATAASGNINHLSGSVRELGNSSSRSFYQSATSALQLNNAISTLAYGFSVMAIYMAGKELINYADSLKLIDSRVKVATASQNDYVNASQALLAVSLDTHTALDDNATLFARTNKSIEAMGGNMGNTIAFSDLLAKSLKISGASAGETSSVIRQMSQAMASGLLRGDEYNSLLENGSRAAYALADGLGVSLGELRKMAEAGELTAPKVLQAMLTQAQMVNSEFRLMPITVASAMTDIGSQFGAYINRANTANGATSNLASGLESVAENLPQILDLLIVVGETAFTALAVKGVGSTTAYINSQVAMRKVAAESAAAIRQQTLIENAHSEALAANNVLTAESAAVHAQANLVRIQGIDANVAALRSQSIAEVQLTNAQVRNLEMMAALAPTEQHRTLAMQNLTIALERQAFALQELHVLDAEQARLSGLITAAEVKQTAATNALTAAQAEQAAVVARLAAAQAEAARAANIWRNGMTYLNAAFAGFAGYEFGTWLSSFNGVANTAAEIIGGLAQDFNDLNTLWQMSAESSMRGNDKFIQEHERNAQAISENINGTIKWREQLSQAGLSVEQYKSYLVQLRSPQETFNIKAEEATRIFKAGLITFDQYNQKLIAMRNELDRLNETKQSPFLKYAADMQDKINQLKLSPLDYQNSKIPKDIVDENEIAKAKALNAEYIAAQESKKALAEQTKALDKDENQAIKRLSANQKSAYDQQLKQLERITQAKQALNALDEKALEFNYSQVNIGLKTFLAEKERLIRSSTDFEVQQLEKQKQAATAFASRMDAVHAAIKQIESKGKIDAVSPDGAIGTMQVLPSTLKSPGLGMSGMAVGSLTDDSNRDALKAFAVKYANEIQVFGEEYFDRLLKRYNGDLNKAAAAYNMGFSAFEKAGMKPNNAETIAYVKNFNAVLADGSQEQIASAEKIAQLSTQQAALYSKEKSELADLQRFAITEIQAYTREVDALKLKYIEMTGTAREAFLARQAADSQGILKKANANNDTATVQLVNDVNNAALLKRDTEAARAYQDRLLQVTETTKQLGLTSSDAFDIMNKGAGGLSNAFNSLIKSLDDVNQAILKNGLDQQAIMADNTLSNEEWAGLMAANAKQAIKLEQQKTVASLTGLRQVAGATGDMFADNTAARQAFHDVEMTLGGIELAYNLYTNAESIASNAVLMTSNIAAAASKVWSQLGIFAPIGLGIMAASLAAWGAGALGDGGQVVEIPQSSPDTGTVLGDTAAQSQSTDNIYQLLKDIHAAEYPELRGINNGVNDLHAALSSTITTLFQAGGLDLSNTGINTSYTLGDSLTRSFTTGAGIASTILSTGIGTAISLGTTAMISALSGAAVAGGAVAGPLAGLGLGSIAGPIGMVAGLIFSGINALFTGGYRDVVERGIQTPTQTIGDIQMGGFKASQYNVVKTREWDLFSDSTRFDTIQTKLSTEVETAISNVFVSAGNVSLQLAEALGNDLDQKVKSYVIPALKIDLTKLSAEDASKKLNAVISTALDKMAVDVFGDTVGQYQQIGEGMLETTVRIVSEIAVVRDALNQSGIQMGSDAIAISDALVTAAGGLKEFQQQFSDYYDKFYSDTEKQTRLQGVLSSQLGSVYLALPDTRSGYRDLVEALDLNNAKDRERYSILLQLASAADSYYNSLESGLKSYQDNIVSAYDTAAGLLQRQIDTYRGFVDQLTAYKDSLLTGNQSTATPEQKYAASKNAFLEIKQTLATGTTAEKESALGNLQSVIAKYLEASRGYNASGAAYIKDFTDAQALLTSAINTSDTTADVAQLQLDTLTKQVTELGLIKSAVNNVETAVNAVGIAISILKEFQQAQQNAAKEAANRAAFNSIEAGRKSAYNAPIAAQAQARGEMAQKQESRIGWDAGASNWAFSGEANISASTGAVTSGEVYTGHSQSVVDQLKNENFRSVREQFGAIGNMLQNIVGGSLPEVFVKVESSGDGSGNPQAKATYRFADKSASVAGDNIDPLVRLYANDATDYLADQLANKDWASQIKAINFSSIGAGVSELSTLMSHLKNPFKNGEYDAKKDYTKIDGSHREGLARVPYDGYIAELHQGERVLTAEQASVYSEQAASVFANWYQSVMAFGEQPATQVDRNADDKTPGVLEAPQRIEISIARPNWLNEPQQPRANSNTPGVSGNDKEVIEQLKKQNAELVKQTHAMEKTIKVLQAGFNKMIEQGDNQIESLDGIETRMRIRELG